MTIEISNTLDKTTYNQRLQALIQAVEGIAYLPYVDTVGVPTIGWGFALSQGSAKPVILNYIIETLLGINAGVSGLSTTAVVKEQGFLTQLKSILNQHWTPDTSISHNQSSLDLQAALNMILDKRASDIANKNGYVASDQELITSQTPVSAPRVFGFTSLTQMQAVFIKGQTAQGSGYEDTLNRISVGLGLPNGIQNSNERIALFAILYQGAMGSSFQTLLKDAFSQSDPYDARAQAWYAIRYGQNSAGLGQRAYMEAALFGLFADSQLVSDAQARAIYRMYSKHSDSMRVFDGQHAANLSSANQLLAQYGLGDVATALSLTNSLQPAANALIQKYGQGQTFSSLNIYVAQQSGSTINRYPDESVDLIIGDTGYDTLVGGSADDVLVGGGGNNLMKGGIGNDKYIYSIGDQVDSVIDTDGKGSIFVQNGAGGLQPLTGGNATVNVYTWNDAKTGAQYKFVPAFGAADMGDLTITGGALGSGQIVINNFDLGRAETDQSGYLGIKFQKQNAIAINGDPFRAGSSKPDNLSTTTTGALQPFKIYASTASDTAQTATLSIAGDDPSHYKANIGDGFLDFSSGSVKLTIPAGADSVTVGLVYTGMMSQSPTVQLTSTLLDATNPDSTSPSSNTLSVTFDNSQQPKDPTFDNPGTPVKDTVTESRDNAPFSYTRYQPPSGNYNANLVITVEDGPNKVIVGDGNNSVVAGSGNDSIFAGDAQSTSSNVINGNGGKDRIEAFGHSNNVITANGGQDIILGSDGHNSIYGGAKLSVADAIAQAGKAMASGQKGNFISTGIGASTVVGGTGDDLILLAGNDLVIAGPGSVTIEGGVRGDATPTWTAHLVSGATTGTIVYTDAVVSAAGPNQVPPSDGANTFTDGQPVGGGNDSIFGGTGNDLIIASNGDNYIDAGGGNSTINGGAGNDTIFGGTGNVSISGGGGNDYIDAESGQDTIFGGSGNNTIFGGDGRSTLYANNGGANWATLNGGNNYVEGGSGNTLIFGSGGNDTLVAGTGNDTIKAGAGNTTIEGGKGSDQLWGGAGMDVISAGDGGTADAPTLVIVGDGDTTVFGGNGIDVIAGGKGNNVLHAGDGGTAAAPTKVQAGSGNTTIYGGGGVDVIQGGKGTNVIYAGDGGTASAPTVVTAGSGNTTIYGGAGIDQIFGGAGTDILYAGNGGTDATPTLVTAGSGNDTLVAGAGVSQLVGNAGRSTYLINADSGNTTIFHSAVGDTLQFGAGITVDAVSVSAQLYSDGSTGLIFKAGTGSATVVGGLGGGINQFRFANGSTLTLTQLMQQADVASQDLVGNGNEVILSGAAGDSLSGGNAHYTVYGFGANDTLVGATGSSTLVGGGGNAKFAINTATSQTTIKQSTSSDALQLGAGIRASDLTVTDSSGGSAPVTTVNLSSGGSIAIEGGGAATLSTVSFADGSTTTFDQLRLLSAGGTAKVTNPDGSYSTIRNDGSGTLTTTEFDKNGIKLSDSWTKADNSHGTDTFNSDGSSSGSISYASGLSSSFTNDGHGLVTTKNYTAAGALVSTTSVATDALGDVLTTNYDANGGKTVDSWTKADGSHGTDTFNADGSSFGSSAGNADGTTTSYTNDGHGGSMTLISKAGVKVGDSWAKADGSHGRDYFNADGSSSGVSYKADGTYSTYRSNAQGELAVVSYDAQGNQTGETLTAASSPTRIDHPDGSYTIVADDHHGTVTDTSYDAHGLILGDSWTKADGSYGSDAVSGAIKTGAVYLADGSYRRYYKDGEQPTLTSYYAWDGRLLNTFATGLTEAGGAFPMVGSYGTQHGVGMGIGSNTYYGLGASHTWDVSFGQSGKLADGILTIWNGMAGINFVEFANPDGTRELDGAVANAAGSAWSVTRQVAAAGTSMTMTITGGMGVYGTLQDDGNGNVTAVSYSASGVKATEWVHSDGTYGVDIVAPDGYNIGVVGGGQSPLHAEGSFDEHDKPDSSFGPANRYFISGQPGSYEGVSTQYIHANYYFSFAGVSGYTASPGDWAALGQQFPVSSTISAPVTASLKSAPATFGVPASGGSFYVSDKTFNDVNGAPITVHYTATGAMYAADPQQPGSDILMSSRSIYTDPGYATDLVAGGIKSGWSYDLQGVPLSSYRDDGKGHVVTRYYDAQGRATGYNIAITAASGDVSTTRYDMGDHIVGSSMTIADARGQVTTTTYDDVGHATGHSTLVSDGHGNSATAFYDAAGVLLTSKTTTVTGVNEVTATAYDANGRPTSAFITSTDSQGVIHTSDYNADGKLIDSVVASPDSQGNVTTSNYDANGVLTGYGVIKSDGAHGSVIATYDAHGNKLRDDTLSATGVLTSHSNQANGASETVTRNPDGSFSKTVSDGAGYVVTTNYDAAEARLGDAWTRDDGSKGSDTFNVDGSASGRTSYADGTSSSYIQTHPGQVTSTHYASDGKTLIGSTVATTDAGGVATSNYGADGAKTGDTWSKTDGTSGSDVFNSDGTHTSIVNDGRGMAVTTQYNAQGTKTADSWTKTDGTSGSDTYGADGGYTKVINDGHGGIDTIVYDAHGVITSETKQGADGGIVTDDGHGNITTVFYDANHVKTRDSWTKSDGSSGSDTYAADGSYSSIVNDGQGRITTSQFNKEHIKISDSWSKTDGSTGMYYADGHGYSISVTFDASGNVLAQDATNADGTRSVFSSDGHGNSTTAYYAADGTATGDNWNKADGSHGYDYTNPDGSGGGAVSNADGSVTLMNHTSPDHNGLTVTNSSMLDASGTQTGSSVTTADGKGDVVTINYDAAGVQLSERWTRSDGSSGSGDGSVLGAAVSDGNGGTITTRYGVFGARISDSWTKADGSSGTDAFATDGSSSGTTTYTDGTSKIYNTFADGGGDWSTFDASGRKLTYYSRSSDGSFWTYTNTYQSNGDITDVAETSDGSHGTDIIHPDGSASGTWVDASTGTASTYNYNAADGTDATTWQAVDGTHGTDIYYSDRSASGTRVNVDGSSSSYTNDGLGNIFTTLFDKNGYKTGDTWVKADGTSGSDSFDFVDSPPILSNAIASQSTDEAKPFRFVIPSNTFTDPDTGDVLAYSVRRADGTALPAWLTFDATTATLSGTPGDADTGVQSILVTATDKGGLAVSTSLTLTVNNVNEAPALSVPVANQGAAEAIPFTFALPAGTFTDPDAGDTLSFKAAMADGSALPSWLSFDPKTQTFFGTPAHADLGTLNVTVTATDAGGLSSADTFHLNVTPPPVQQTVGNTLYSSGSAVLPADLQNLTGTGSGDLTLTGNALANVITANSGNDTLIAGSGAATLIGGAGNDTFVINRAIDVIAEAQNHGKNLVLTSVSYALPANVQNMTGTGKNALILVGNDLANVITANGGNDTLIAGSGLATLIGGPGNDTFRINNVNDVIVEQPNHGKNTVVTSVSYVLPANVQNITGTGSANLTLTGNALDNVITGSAGNDTLIAGSGNATLVAGSGITTMIGGPGNDTFTVNNTADIVIEHANSGKNTVLTSVSYVLPANVQNITASGSASVILTGNNLNNVITGNSGNDTLVAGTGNTTLVSGSAITTMIGGTGDDVFKVNNSADVIIEEPNHGRNTVITTVSYVLPANVQNITGVGTANLKLTGNDLNNIITGNAGNDTLVAGAGNDTLIAGSGVATLIGGTGNDTFRINNAADVIIKQVNTGKNTVVTSVSYVLPANVQNITASGSGNISVTGNNLANVITGNAGNDTLIAGTGDATLVAGTGVATMQGGLANNTYKVNNASDVIVAQAGALSNNVFASVSYALGANLHNLTLTGKGNLTATGNSLDDVITGNAGNDTLIAGSGNTTLVAGSGLATLVGGSGNDTFKINNIADVIIEQPNGGVNTVLTSVSYVLPANVQNMTGTGSAGLTLTGNDLANVITANNGNDTLVAGSGLATLVGGTGSNTFVVNNAADVIIKQAASGRNAVQTSVSYVLPANIQAISGTGSADLTLTGNDLANVITGNAGSDTLIAGSGDATLVAGSGLATMKGGLGRNTYVVNNAADVINAQAAALANAVETSVSYVLPANVKALTGTGSADLTLSGNDLANVITGNAGNDTLIAGTGDATLVAGSGLAKMVGGLGHNTFKVNNVADVIDAQAGALANTVQTSVSYVLPANVKTLTGTGNADLTLTGNDLANVITANAGNDTLIAGSGDATLVAGAGIATMQGGLGHNTFRVNNVADVIVAKANALENSVQTSVSYVLPSNVSALTGTGSADLTLTGNELNDVITGNAGNDTLIAGAGGATLVAGSGLATLIGGAGNDTFKINNVLDVIVEKPNAGINTVLTTVSYVLPDNVQNITATGTASVTLTGNGLNNVITGNAGNDTLIGGSGNATLVAGSGVTTLIGGSGDNLFKVNNASDVVIARAGGLNTIQSSVSFVLPDNVQDLILTGTANLAATGNGGNDLIVANSGNDTLTGGTGIDVLQGGAGRNTLRDLNGSGALLGAAGSDTITGGTGAAFIAGGASNDVIALGSGASVIAFNKGDGKDTISGGAGSTLSLGGGIGYAGLSLSKSGSNLVLSMGGTDSITLLGWYATAPVHEVATLQMIEQASTDYDATSSNVLVNQKVELFDFGQLVAQFDQARAQNSSLTSWSAMNGLLSTHLSGSDTAAIGGDLAYYQGTNGGLSGIDLAAAVATLQDAQFGKGSQAVHAWGAISQSANTLR